MAQALTWYTEQNIPTDGADDNAWGTNVIGPFQMFDRALAGFVAKDVTAGNVTLSATEAQQSTIAITGSPTAARTVFIPNGKARPYQIRNSTLTDQVVSVQMAGPTGTALAIPRSGFMRVYCDGTTIFAVGPPVAIGGGFLPSYTTSSVARPGMFFADAGGSLDYGFSQFTAGISVHAGATISKTRFHNANTETLPLIGIRSTSGSAYNMGFFAPSDTILGVTVAGDEFARLTSTVMAIGRTTTSGNNPGILLYKDGLAQFERSAAVAVVVNRIGATDGGLILFRKNNVDIGSINANGSATQYLTTSDRELKENIGPPGDLWEIIRRVMPRAFHWKGQPGTSTIGFVAQEAYWPMKAVAGAVEGHPDRDLEKDGPMSIDYSKFVPVAWWGIRALDLEVEKIKARLVRGGL